MLIIMMIFFATAIGFLIKSNQLFQKSEKEQDSYQSVILFYASKRHNKIAMTFFVLGFMFGLSILYEHLIAKSNQSKTEIKIETYE